VTVELNQAEIEQVARSHAERLLTPRERVAANSPPSPMPRPSEPTLEERLAAIDRRAREHADAEKRAIATFYLEQARTKFADAVSRTVDAVLRAAYDELRRVERLT
jgi:hypothetical protein